jgi:hypothetical protein
VHAKELDVAARIAYPHNYPARGLRLLKGTSKNSRLLRPVRVSL